MSIMFEPELGLIRDPFTLILSVRTRHNKNSLKHETWKRSMRGCYSDRKT